ncbi:MAG: hypothetical protein VKM01_04190 [Cyanobacteriota bacterium]|nr:hypothetical protein [Cyanobacteriota bacterium]
MTARALLLVLLVLSLPARAQLSRPAGGTLSASGSSAMGTLGSSQAGSNSDANAYGAASNQQSNSSASNSWGGNNNSYQYNTEFGKGAEYGFSTRQLRCEGPRAFVGLWADPQDDYWYNNQLHGQNSWEMRGGAGVTLPFGAFDQTCRAMSRLLEEQLRFDTAVGIVRACQGLRREGIALDAPLLGQFPALMACQALSQPLTTR